MREVTQKEFFQAINPLNVHPRIVSEYDRMTGYKSEWRMQDCGQRIVGVTISGTQPYEGCNNPAFGNPQYFLA